MRAQIVHQGGHRAAFGRSWLAATTLALAALLVPTLAPTRALAQSRHAAMVIDANTGQVLHAQAADEPRYPASLTKMMTLYIVFEMIEQGRLQPSTRIRVSPNAAATAPSKLGLEAGEEITVANVIQALIVKSANDMAVAIAEHIAGSESKFAALMTQKARQLGMSKTTFRNAHGLPDPEQATTARDMLTLAMRLSDDFPQHYKLFSLRSFSYDGDVYRNHNIMLASYRGMDGLKTGYTGQSGFNLVASVRRDGRHVVAVVFGGSSAATRNALMRAILDRALPRAATERTRRRNPLVARAPRPAPAPRRTAEPRLVEPVAIAPPPPAKPQSPPVEIARVRPIMVAPRSRPARAPDPVREPPVAVPASAPAPVEQQPPRGTPPSTLQEQAERLQRGQPAVVPPPAQPPRAQPRLAAAPAPTSPTYRLNGPAAQPAKGAALIIQIGAFSSEAEALRQIADAKARAAGVLGDARPFTQPVTSAGRQLYRARFQGFDAAGAANACNELRRQRFDCLVTAPGG